MGIWMGAMKSWGRTLQPEQAVEQTVESGDLRHHDINMMPL